MALVVQAHPDKYGVRYFPAEGEHPAFTVVRAYDGNSTVSLFMTSPGACDELIRAAAEAKRLLAGEPEQPAWCPAVLTGEDEAFHCDRDPGHPGSHHAPGPDEGSEIAWSDERDFAGEAGHIAISDGGAS